MVENSPEAEPAFWSWFGFWAQLVLLGICVVVGAFAASRAAAPGNYGAGMVLIIGAVALGFLRIKQRFDGDPIRWRDSLFVDRMASLAVIVPLFVVIALAGLFIARAWPYGALHDAGIALFAASGVIVFLDIKQVFDHLNSRSPQ